MINLGDWADVLIKFLNKNLETTSPSGNKLFNFGFIKKQLRDRAVTRLHKNKMQLIIYILLHSTLIVDICVQIRNHNI